jgi:hypothetical protein
LDGPKSLVSVLEDLYYELYTSILSETTNWQVWQMLQRRWAMQWKRKR